MNVKGQRQALNVFKAIDGQLDKALTMLLAGAIATIASSLIKLKADNRFNVSNISNIQYGWGPETNYARVLFIIVAGTGLFFGLQYLKRRFGVKWFRIGVAVFAASVFFMAHTAPLLTSSSVDMFHTGEQMSPALDYTKDKQLYKDLFFLHGAGEDVLLPSLAFNLFGQSIGSVALFGNLLASVSILLFFLLVGLLIRPAGLYLLAVTWFLGTTYGGAEYTKNIPVFTVLGLLWAICQGLLAGRRRMAGLFSVGLLASLSLLLAIDVGVIMLVLCGLFGLVLLLSKSQKDRSISLDWQRIKRLSSYYEPAILAGGIITAQILMLAALRPGGYSEFIRMTVSEIPNYQGLMFDYPMPFIDNSSYLFWLPVFLAIVASIMLIQLIVRSYREIKGLTPSLLYASLLFIFSILYMRFGVGRPDAPHIFISTGVFFVAGFYIIQLFLRSMLYDKKVAFEPWAAILFIGLLFWPINTWDPTKIVAAANTKPSDVAKAVRLPNKPDTDWLSSEQRKVVRFIKANTDKNDYLYVHEPEPLYYYLTDRRNPSRFYISWFADPQPYTDEMLRDLKKNPPKYVIYSGPPTTEVSDGVPIRDRIPEVDAWVVKNYPQKTHIGHTVILGK